MNFKNVAIIALISLAVLFLVNRIPMIRNFVVGA
jgi:hypothetical protein